MKMRFGKLIARAARVLDRRGVTLVELIVAILVFSVITIAVTSVFAPILRTYDHANNIAEANSLLDNISALIINDIDNAMEVADSSSPFLEDSPFTIRTARMVSFYINADGIMMRSVSDQRAELLPKDFYKSRGDGTVFTIGSASSSFDNLTGVVTISLTLRSIDGWELEREYTARPVGLM